MEDTFIGLPPHSWPLLIGKEIIQNKALTVLSRDLSTFCPHQQSICSNLLSQGDSLCLCWKQVRQDFQSTNMFPTDPWMRSSPICPAGPRRTAASWRALRENAACCGGSWNAGCWVVRLSTGRPTESRRPRLLTAARAFRAVRICLLCLNAPAAALLPGTARLVF